MIRIMLLSAALLPAFHITAIRADSPPLMSVRFVPLTGPEQLNGLANKPLVLGDRFIYFDDDATGQFYVMTASGAVTFTLRDSTGRSLTYQKEATPAHPKAHVIVRTAMLKPGDYILAVNGAEFPFKRESKRREAAKFPDEGVPILLHAQDVMGSADWPIRAGVPLPPGAVTDANQLVVTRDGQRIPAEVVTRATWSPQGPARWVHVNFMGQYRDGKAADYRLMRSASPSQEMPTTLRCEQKDDLISVDTGAIRFEVSRKSFTGIARAWIGQRLIIDGSKGPYIVDGRGIRWDASRDVAASVTVESLSSTRVVIAAEGWYANPEVAGEPLCRFKTRLIAYHGSPMISVQHHTIIAYDTRLYRLADAGFDIAPVGAAGYRFGVDGQVKEGALPAKGPVFMHQDRFDHLRVVADKTTTEGKRSDGWAAAKLDGGGSLAVTLRDLWQKFPKELSVSRETPKTSDNAGGPASLALHFWPAHGQRAFKLEDELEPRNIYKYWCFHQHRLLDLQLPADYYETFQQLPGTFENTPEIALMSNAMGTAIGDDFAVTFLPEEKNGDAGGWAKLFEQDPTGHAPPEWNASTLALGDIAAADRAHFADIEDVNEKGFLSYTHSMERGNEYGMWNYADTHTYWNVKENYADLHRVWHNSHYHEAGTTWLLYYRTGSKSLLDWARPSTDHYINIGTINWEPPSATDDFKTFLGVKPTIVEGKVQASFNHWWLFRSGNAEQAPWYAFIDAKLNVPPPGTPSEPPRFAVPGAMYHCKGLTHWGRKDYAMGRGEAHAWIWGHWMDPDASLWMWYLDADPRAADVYDIWYGSVKRFGLPRDGVAREINTAVACAVTLYEHTWDADLLPYIHGMALGLRTNEPLDQQQPGGMWHPLWINRYYGLTRDPRFVPFILEYAKQPGLAGTWVLGLSALAYELSGDKTYLTRQFDQLRNWPDQVYHKAGDPYDWYGQGPGPIGSRWGEMTWGHFLRQLHRAGMANFDAVPPQPGHYPSATSNFEDLKSPASATVYILDREDKPFDVNIQLQSMGGDLHTTSLVVIDPAGKVVNKWDRVPPRGGPSSWRDSCKAPADGQKGLYRLEVRSHACSISGPISPTAGMLEAALLPPGKLLSTWRLRGALLPIKDGGPVTLKISPSHGRTPTNLRVYDTKGGLIQAASLLADRGDADAVIRLDPAQHSPPWRIEAAGVLAITHDAADGLLLGPDEASVGAIRAALAQKP